MRRAGSNAAFFLLCAGAALLFCAFFMLGPLAPLLSAALGAPPAVIGAVISAAYLFPLFLAIPVGSVVDRIGAKPMLLIGAGLLAGAPWLVTAVPSLAALVALQILAGLGQLVAVVAAQAVVASYGGGAARERNFGWYGTFVSAGQLVGPVLAGVLVDVAGFRSAYAVAGAVSLAAVLAFVVLPVARRTGMSAAGVERKDEPVAPRASMGADRMQADARRASRRPLGFVAPRELLALTRLPTVQVSLWVSATVMVVLIGHGSFLPAYLDSLAMPASVIGVILSGRSLASIVVRPFMATLVALMGGRFRSFLVTVVASSVGLAGIALGDNLIVLFASSLLLGLSIGIAQPLTMVAVVEEVDPQGHGVAFGLRITINRLVQFTAPLALGVVAQAAGYPLMFVVASVAVVATCGLLAARRSRYAAIDREAA